MEISPDDKQSYKTESSVPAWAHFRASSQDLDSVTLVQPGQIWTDRPPDWPPLIPSSKASLPIPVETIGLIHSPVLQHQNVYRLLKGLSQNVKTRKVHSSSRQTCWDLHIIPLTSQNPRWSQKSWSQLQLMKFRHCILLIASSMTNEKGGKFIKSKSWSSLKCNMYGTQ